MLTLVLLPFFSSMLVTNDVALLTFVPFAILILNMADASAYAPYIIVLQTVAANLGSMATPVGNPQNLFLYNRFALSPADFFCTDAAPCGGQPCAAVHGRAVRPPRAVTVAMGDVHGYNTRRLPALSVLFVLCLLCVFRVAPYQLLTAVVLAMLTLFMRDLFRKWITACCSHLYFLLYFRGQHGKDRRVTNALLSALMDKHALPTCVLASQVVSNVPAAVLLSGFSQNWRVLLTGMQPWRPRHAHCLSRKPDLPQALCPLRAGAARWGAICSSFPQSMLPHWRFCTPLRRPADRLRRFCLSTEAKYRPMPVRECGRT